MNGVHCHSRTNTQQDHRFFLANDQHTTSRHLVGMHIVRNEDMDAIYHADDETDDALEEFHGNTVHFIA